MLPFGPVQAVERIDGAAGEIARRIVDNVGRVLEGKRDVIELAVVALLRARAPPRRGRARRRQDHARTRARALGRRRVPQRIQFTSRSHAGGRRRRVDLDQGKSEFVFRPGPIFTNVLLADEINRTTPKTQSALLEAMDERQRLHRRRDARARRAVLRGRDAEPRRVLRDLSAARVAARPVPAAPAIGYPPRARRAPRDPEPPWRGSDARARRGRRSRDAARRASAPSTACASTRPLIEYLHAIVLATRKSPMLELGRIDPRRARDRACRARARDRERPRVRHPGRRQAPRRSRCWRIASASRALTTPHLARGRGSRRSRHRRSDRDPGLTRRERREAPRLPPPPRLRPPQRAAPPEQADARGQGVRVRHRGRRARRREHRPEPALSHARAHAEPPPPQHGAERERAARRPRCAADRRPRFRARSVPRRAPRRELETVSSELLPRGRGHRGWGADRAPLLLPQGDGARLADRGVSTDARAARAPPPRG